jgi:formylglycine-generating enzyme
LSRNFKLLVTLVLILFSASIVLLGRFLASRQGDFSQLLNNNQPTTDSTVEKPTKPEIPKVWQNLGHKTGEYYGRETAGHIVPEMLSLPGGSFLMGATNEGSIAEQPQHRVNLAPFQISRFEITNFQFLTFCQAAGHQIPPDPHWQDTYMKDFPNHPAVNITFQDALDYCAWLSQVLGKSVSLPTEAEWEYAAADAVPGTTLETTTGQIMPTTGVGFYGPNKFGLYDMLGNTWEWCTDWHAPTYYTVSPVDNPQGPESGEYRVIRGGSWANKSTDLRITYRSRALPTGASPTTGFRVVIRETTPASTN